MALKPEYTYPARLIRVVDGDTYDLSVDLGFGITNRIRVRLMGANTPEIHNVKHGTPEHEAGQAAAEAARRWMTLTGGRKFMIRTHKEKGKFGRWLADVESYEGESLAESLIRSGFARAADEDGNDIERRGA